MQGWWFSVFQDTDLTSAKMEGFCQGCGLGYGNKERRSSWNYAEWARLGVGQHFLGAKMLVWPLGEEEAPARGVDPGHGDKETFLSPPTYFVLTSLSSTNSTYSLLPNKGPSVNTTL